MKLEELTGRQRPTNIPKTAQEVMTWVKCAIESGRYKTDGEFLDALAVLLGNIGNELLDDTKKIGVVSYADGPILDEWPFKEGKYPFHIKDNITGKNVADPRVVLIGRLAYQLGSVSGQGHEYMYELYVLTGKYYHSYMSSLSIAWDGIGSWRY